jgi:putative FmdB family regulatory protein
MFEYRCTSCSSQFETLVRGAEIPVCPRCGGRDLEKQLSVFAVSSHGGSGAPSSCDSGGCALPSMGGGCSTGACPFN